MKNKIKKVNEDKKFVDGPKTSHVPHSSVLICAECGCKISQREEHKNGGLCDICFEAFST